jgi:hypothetical protein
VQVAMTVAARSDTIFQFSAITLVFAFPVS